MRNGFDLVKPSDAIFYPVGPRSDWASKFVAIGEMLLRMGRDLRFWSHCSIVDVDTDHQLEAYWPRTRRSKIDMRRPFEVWRLKDETPAKRDVGIRWAYTHLGEWYNMLGLLFGWIGIHFHERYCSEFLRSINQAQGFEMPRDEKGYFSPNQAFDYYQKHGYLVYYNKGS